MSVETPLIIHQDGSRCIINYDHLMHIRRFIPSVSEFLKKIMPTAKIINYYCIGLFGGYLPVQTDLPDIKFEHNSRFVDEEFVESLKIINCEEPTIFIVEFR